MVEASPQRANMGFIGAIVAVATIGGFLFGYDSGAVNGTQPGLTEAFGLVPGSFSPSNGLGFTVASLLIGSPGALQGLAVQRQNLSESNSRLLVIGLQQLLELRLLDDGLENSPNGVVVRHPCSA